VSRRAVVVAGGGLAVALVAGAVWSARGNSAGAEAEPGSELRTGLARVERRDLVRRETLSGTLGYADSRPLAAAGAGTLTAIAAEGATVRRGGVLYTLDGRPVYLLEGSVPAWRLLRSGDEGADVRQLEGNLVALGYDPDGDIEVDGDFDSATAAAVRRWEEKRGVTEDGVVELGEVVFLPGTARRMGGHEGEIGAGIQPGTPIATTSSTRRIVTIDLEATRQDLVRKGAAVSVVLPDGRSVPGTISQVGTVAEAQQSQDPEAETDPTVEVTITIRGSAGSLDGAPVDVEVESERSEDALVVPVNALLALAGGGYAVELDRNGTRTLVAVDPGLYADGLVAIEADGVKDGDRVVVPR
jgi:peptidoglycan hydrolase-like protein with peptidoglycan-binding domain